MTVSNTAFQIFSGNQDTTPATSANLTTIFVVGDPAGLVGLVSANVSANDAKFYLRQHKEDFWCVNNSNSPIFVRYTYFRVRKSIAVNDYPTWASLLNEDTSVTITQFAAPCTTSAVAQKYLKWTKTRIVKYDPGAFWHWKLNLNLKKTKVIAEDLYADTNYLGTPLTRGCIMKVIPVPVSYFSGAAGTYTATGLAFAGANVSVVEQTYVSGYAIGQENPNNNFTFMPIPSSGSRFNIYNTAGESRVTQVN